MCGACCLCCPTVLHGEARGLTSGTSLPKTTSSSVLISQLHHRMHETTTLAETRDRSLNLTMPRRSAHSVAQVPARSQSSIFDVEGDDSQ